MKFSRKVEVCGLSPVRKFYPYEVAAEAKGLKIRHLNIGQPDIETPDVFFDAIRNFEDKVIAYAPAPGTPEFVEAAREYYQRFGCNLSGDDILATFGGSEALQIVMSPIIPTMIRSSALPARPSGPFPPRRKRAITMPTAAASSR